LIEEHHRIYEHEEKNIHATDLPIWMLIDGMLRLVRLMRSDEYKDE
jgi:hypothetical protein